MDINTFRKLHYFGSVSIPRSFFRNDLPSCTDPTQDVPVKNIQMMGDVPLNVRVMKKLQMNGVKIENMTALDRRNNDKFDVLGELQGSLQDTSNKLTKFKQKNEK